MANNPDFKKVVVRDTELRWPRLDQPYRFNQVTSKTEPCAPTAANAQWSVSWKLPADEAAAFESEMAAHFAACKGRDSKKYDTPYGGVFGRRKEDDGSVQFTAKKGAVNHRGDVNDPPRVFGADHEPLEDRAFWTGSKGSLRAWAFPVKNPQTGEWGMRLNLDTVVVTEPAYGGSNLSDDFGAPALNHETDDIPF